MIGTDKMYKKVDYLRNFLAFFLILFALCPAFSQPRFSSQGHKGKVTSIFAEAESKEGAFWTSGTDGFLIRWQNGIGEHFQVTDKSIMEAVPSPNGKEIAFYETDGGIYYSVKVFDTGSAKVKRSMVFKAPVLSLAYSARGTYLIVSTNVTDGLYFYTSSSGKPWTKIKGTGMMVSWAATGSSEKNAMFYSPDGRLCYYSLKNGKLIKEVQTEPNLEGPALFAKSLCLSGRQNSSLCIVNTENGRPIKNISSPNPLIFGGEESLYYFSGKGDLYSLYEIRLSEKGLRGPLVAQNFKAPKDKTFTAFSKTDDTIFLGSEDGKVFTGSLQDTGLPLSLSLVSNEVYREIHDICSNGQDLFILTENSVIKASYENRPGVSFANGKNWTNMTLTHEKLILGTDNRRDGLYSMDLDGKNEKFLFTPASRVKKIREATLDGKKGFLEIESDRVYFYDFAQSSLKELYAGSGIQDALIFDGSSLFVAKTASSKPNTPLVLVNLKTRETVPVKMDGDIAYSLEADKEFVYGIRLTKASEGYTSSAFAMGTKAFSVKELVNSAKEETESFISANYPRVFTNVGGKEISVLNVKTLRKYTLKKSASLPKKLCAFQDRLAVLNQDSSITWYNKEQPIALADWYINSENEIVEF